MFSRTKIMTPTPPYSERVDVVGNLVAEADFVLVGAGAGLSAAAGLNYQDPALFARWYPQFRRLGICTIWECITTHWAPDDANRRRFWAFWSHHILRIRYDTPAAVVYSELHQLVSAKKHFVITTNVDGQFHKAGFDPRALFTPQGDYGKFQCDQPCCDSLYDNHTTVRQMVANTDPESLLIRDTDIPRCPACGSYLERNLRRDVHFVEAPHMERQPAYAEFVNRSFAGRLLLLEFGVGFNTPSIIRWPFERIAIKHPCATLVRVNLDDAKVPDNIEQRSISFHEDVALVLKDLSRLSR
jgi:NAD-dependent SIR2 family protein deacetylase